MSVILIEEMLLFPGGGCGSVDHNLDGSESYAPGSETRPGRSGKKKRRKYDTSGVAELAEFNKDTIFICGCGHKMTGGQASSHWEKKIPPL